MSHVSRRASRQQRQHLHLHCESCYSVRCRARVEPAVSCPLAACRLLCGASFHLCKEEEHLLLCPSVRVPCLNAQYGCPATMPRAWRASHLRLCPASVVSCSMEWNRWPVDDTNPHNSAALQENALRAEEGQGEALDMALALADQRALYARLKMKHLYPELMEEEEEEEEETKEEEKKEKATGEHINSVIQEETADRAEPASGESSSEPVANGIQEAKPDAGGDKGGARPTTGVRMEKRDLCEMMFSMEKGGCAAAQANLKDHNKQSQGAGESGAAGRREVVGHAPWSEGVLERLGQELSPQEFNMYLVHHGRMLLNFGQIHACTPREKDFVYGSLEPIPVQTLRSFKVPDSYRYKRRVQLYDTSTPSEERGVDTSDLVTSQDDWNSDEAKATLLGYAEIEVMGHKISESKGTDGLYVDEGTQTHLFSTAPFKRKATLAEVTAGRPLELRVQLQAESVSSRHNKGSSVFTFLCGHAFRRREFPTHYRNVHSDIQTGLSGWFEQRCPLAYLGCTYTQRRFQPSTHKATVTYDQELGSFSLRPDIPTPPSEGSLPPGTTAEATSGQRGRGVKGGGGEESLSGLPYEVLCHMASFLDSLSLFQLALVSRLMRDVCSSQLLDRGMVTLHWERSSCSHRGGAKWRAKPVWEFSRLFSAVESWCFAETPPMSAHLKVCPYYETSVRSKRVPLASMIKKQSGDSQERQSLVAQFLGNRELC